VSPIPELTAADFERSIPVSAPRRLMEGWVEPGDVAALRRFVGLTQARLAEAPGISIQTLRTWEQGRHHPNHHSTTLLCCRPPSHDRLRERGSPGVMLLDEPGRRARLSVTSGVQSSARVDLTVVARP